MAYYKGAKQKLLPENETQPKIVPRAIILHSAGGSAELYGWWQNPQSKGLECHFFVDDDSEDDPTVYQYISTDVRADANYKANGFAISIETASTVNASEPWSKGQVKKIIALVDWLCATHNIPREQIKSPYGSGIGWHAMWGAPSDWTPARGKVCPGPARIEQMKKVIIPGVQKPGSVGEEENIMAQISEERFAKLEKQVQVLFDQIIGTKDKEPKEALRQLWRETGQSAQAAEVQTRPKK